MEYRKKPHKHELGQPVKFVRLHFEENSVKSKQKLPLKYKVIRRDASPPIFIAHAVVLTSHAGWKMWPVTWI